jgi:hypothetical protein
MDSGNISVNPFGFHHLPSKEAKAKLRSNLDAPGLALAAMPEAAVVERKTPSDLVAC